MRPQSEQPCDPYKSSVWLLRHSRSTILIIFCRAKGRMGVNRQKQAWKTAAMESEDFNLISNHDDTSVQAKH